MKLAAGANFCQRKNPEQHKKKKTEGRRAVVERREKVDLGALSRSGKRRRSLGIAKSYGLILSLTTASVAFRS